MDFSAEAFGSGGSSGGEAGDGYVSAPTTPTTQPIMTVFMDNNGNNDNASTGGGGGQNHIALSFHVVMWISVLLVVIGIFVALHCYLRRRRNNNINGRQQNASNRNRTATNHDDNDEEKKQQRETQRRERLLSKMISRNMIHTVTCTPIGGVDSSCTDCSTICDVSSSHDQQVDATDMDCEQGNNGITTGDNSNTHSPIALSESMMTCAICLDDYQVNDVVVRSSHPDCDHIFHKDCLLDTFVKKKRKKEQQVLGKNDNDIRYPCPCCRRPYFCVVMSTAAADGETTSMKAALAVRKPIHDHNVTDNDDDDDDDETDTHNDETLSSSSSTTTADLSMIVDAVDNNNNNNITHLDRSIDTEEDDTHDENDETHTISTIDDIASITSESSERHDDEMEDRDDDDVYYSSEGRRREEEEVDSTRTNHIEMGC